MPCQLESLRPPKLLLIKLMRPSQTTTTRLARWRLKPKNSKFSSLFLSFREQTREIELSPRLYTTLHRETLVIVRYLSSRSCDDDVTFPTNPGKSRSKVNYERSQAIVHVVVKLQPGDGIYDKSDRCGNGRTTS